MSNNINEVKVLKNENARIGTRDALLLKVRERKKLPEINFIDDLTGDDDVSFGSVLDDDEIHIGNNFDWCGEGSGWSFDFLKSAVAPCIRGRLELLIVWESGDINGLVIDNGKATPALVSYVLKPVAQT